MSTLREWFLPDPNNNQKAKLIKFYSLFFLAFTFVFFQLFLNFFLLTKPAVLGYSSNITPEKIIELTNLERAKKGLPALKENSLLSEAARRKAADMFAFNYWAHVSPTGRSPWSFFVDVGYRYQYAGENLARDFQDPDAVVAAWMNSPTHRDNIINPKYQEIGVAVVEGTLQGTQTTLVVQLFGTPYGNSTVASTKNSPSASSPEKLPEGAPKPALAQAQEGQPKTSTQNQPETYLQETPKNQPLISPLDITKGMAIFTVGILIGVFLVDILVISKKHTPRLSSKSLAQMLFLIFVLIASLLIKQGAIL